MRILAFSDLHRNVEIARSIVASGTEADVLVGAGDFATRGLGSSEIIDILRSANIPTVLVSGNHDNFEELQEQCKDWTNGHLLHGRSITLNDVTFFGLGGEIPRRNDAVWNETVSEEEATEMLAHCPERAVLVTHTPPFGCADLQNNGTHEGSRAILVALEEKQPILNLCGHIHFSWGAKGKIKDTVVHNLGPTVNWFQL